MAEKQSKPLSPPLNSDKETLADFSSIIQDNMTDLFQLAHRHSIKTSAPAANEGNVGDIVLVEVSGAFSIYGKFSSGWKSTTLT